MSWVGSKNADIRIGLTCESVLPQCFLRHLAGLAPNTVDNFFAMDGNVLRRLNSKTYLIADCADDSNRDVIADVYSLAESAGEYQHVITLIAAGAKTPSVPLITIQPSKLLAALKHQHRHGQVRFHTTP